MKEKNKILKLSHDVAEFLGVETLPIEFAPLGEEDSRLVIRPKSKIVINSKYQNDFVECAKCITHEYRHVYQIYYVKFMNNKLAELWKSELANAKNSGSLSTKLSFNNYKLQAIELDAFAFTYYYLKKLNIIVKNPDPKYQAVIEEYIQKFI